MSKQVQEGKAREQEYSSLTNIQPIQEGESTISKQDSAAVQNSNNGTLVITQHCLLNTIAILPTHFIILLTPIYAKIEYIH